MTTYTQPYRQTELVGHCKNCEAPLYQTAEQKAYHLKKFCTGACRKACWDHANPEKRALIMEERNRKKRKPEGPRRRKAENQYSPHHAEEAWRNIKACTNPDTHRYTSPAARPAEDREAKP